MQLARLGLYIIIVGSIAGITSLLVGLSVVWKSQNRAREQYEEYKGYWGLTAATTAPLLSWQPDPWAAAATQFHFNECDFDSVRVARSSTIATTIDIDRSHAGASESPGRFMYRICPIFGEDGPGNVPRPAPEKDMEVAVSIMNEMDWKLLGLRDWAPQHRHPRKVLSPIRGECANMMCDPADSLRDPKLRNLYVKSRDRCEGVFTKEALKNFPRGPETTQTCNLLSKMRPYAYSLLIWLHRHVQNPSYCSSGREPTKHHFVLEVMALQPWNGTCSLEYTWDGQISSVLLGVWGAVRWSLSIRRYTPWMPTACDFYCCAYIISLVAWFAMELYVPHILVARLHSAAKFCSIMAEMALACAVSQAKLPFLFKKGSQSSKTSDEESLTPLQSIAWSEVMLCLVLWGSALAPVLEEQCPPGFSACADGGDPRLMPEKTRTAVRLFPLVCAIPFLCRMCRNGFRWHLTMMALYVAAPTAAWLIEIVFAHYVQRKLQLIIAVLMLRTTGAVGLILESRHEADVRLLHAALIPVLIVTALLCTLCSGLLSAGTLSPKNVAIQSHHCLWSAQATVDIPVEQPRQNIRQSVPHVRAQVQQKVQTPNVQQDAQATDEDLTTCFRPRQREAALDGWLDANPCEGIRSDILDGQQDVLHVLFTSDLGQLPGLQASISSVLMSAKNPSLMVIHIVVLPDHLPQFKEEFGFQQHCSCMITARGTEIRFHSVGEEVLSRVRGHVPEHVLKERGAIDSFENFVRFYIHVLIRQGVVVYLDADTIVLRDLNFLRKKLLESGVTMGFIRRPSDKLVQMKSILKLQKAANCSTNWSKRLLELPAYNAGVFVMNVERWRQKAVTERVEAFVERHNKCADEGGLWIGGSQPPLLLAFLDHAVNESSDYIDFDPSWNTGELGWRKGMSYDSIRNKSVLHWNGNLKPWLSTGLYREVWQPHCSTFTETIKPQLIPIGLPSSGVAHKIFFFRRHGSLHSGWHLDVGLPPGSDAQGHRSASVLLRSNSEPVTMKGDWVLHQGSLPALFRIKVLSDDASHQWLRRHWSLDLDLQVADETPANTSNVAVPTLSSKSKQNGMWALEEGVAPGLFKLRFVPGNGSLQMSGWYLGAQLTLASEEGDEYKHSLPQAISEKKEQGHASATVIVHDFNSSDAGDWMFVPSEEYVAHAECSRVHLLTEWPPEDAPKKGEAGLCHLGKTFGCLPGGLTEGLWTMPQCRGLFHAYGEVTSCGGHAWGRRWEELPHVVRRSFIASHPASTSAQGVEDLDQFRWCPAGLMPEPHSKCKLMILTSFFTTQRDGQRKRYREAQFKYIHRFYRSTIELGLNVTLIYDELPVEILRRFRCVRFHFLQVDVKGFDAAYGTNEIRFFLYDRLLRQHHDWKYVFVVDAFDVRVVMNPCVLLDDLDDGSLYVGVESDNLRGRPRMNNMFKELGGKYLDWYKEEVDGCMKLVNTGIIGGRWGTVVRLLKHVLAVMSDPSLGPRSRNESINQSVAALNYVAYKRFPGFIGGHPLHSRYKMYETERRDVVFIHK